MNSAIAFLQEISSIAIPSNPDFSSFSESRKNQILQLANETKQDLPSFYPEDINSEEEYINHVCSQDMLFNPTHYEISAIELALKLYPPCLITPYHILYDSNQITSAEFIRLFPFPESFGLIQDDVSVEVATDMMRKRLSEFVMTFVPEALLVSPEDKQMIIDTVNKIVGYNIIFDDIVLFNNNERFCFFGGLFYYGPMIAFIHIFYKKLIEMKNLEFLSKSPEEQSRIRKQFACYECSISEITRIANNKELAIEGRVCTQMPNIGSRNAFPHLNDELWRRRRVLIQEIEEAEEYIREEILNLDYGSASDVFRIIGESYNCARRLDDYRISFHAINICAMIYESCGFTETCMIAYYFGRVDKYDIMNYVLLYPVEFTRIVIYEDELNEEEEDEEIHTESRGYDDPPEGIFDERLSEIVDDEIIDRIIPIVTKICRIFTDLSYDTRQQIRTFLTDIYMDSFTKNRIADKHDESRQGCLWISCIDSYYKLTFIVAAAIEIIVTNRHNFNLPEDSDVASAEWYRMSKNDKQKALVKYCQKKSPTDVIEDFSYMFTYRDYRVEAFIPNTSIGFDVDGVENLSEDFVIIENENTSSVRFNRSRIPLDEVNVNDNANDNTNSGESVEESAPE